MSTITSSQIQASPAQSFGNLFFTLPGATSAGLAPGASRPVLRGLDDFRVRVQENGIGSMDVSDLGQDHGVPIDPLSIQKVEIFRGPEALRYGSQAVGGVVEATNNRIPVAAPLGGWQTQFQGATTTVDRGLEGGALFDAGTRDFAMHADFYGRHASDYFVPSYPYLFPPDPAPSFNGKQPNSGLHSEGQAVGGSYLFDGGYVGAAISRFTSVYRIPTLEGAQTNTRIDLQQTKITSKGEFRPQSSAIDVVRFWLGAVEYHHDEIGIGDDGIDGVQATFNNHAQEAKAEIKFMPMATPFGALISSIGTQFDHQQLDTAGDAGSLLGSARTNRGAAYFYNELWLSDTLRTLLAGRIETVRLDGTAGTFPSTLLPPPDNPDLLLQSLGYMPKSISFSVLKDLPSWMVASATVQRIERAPTALELFAHGAHDAPGTFEIGNPGLKIETANTAEIGLKRTDGAFRFDAKAYYTRYDNFIFRQATGILCGAEFATCGTGTEFIQTLYAQRDAIFRGGEIAWQWDLLPVATGIFGVDGQYDFVRATFTDGSNVPRMPPMRLGGGTYWRNDNWFVRMGLLHAFGQSDLGQNDTPTAGYNLLKMEISNKQYWRDSPWGAAEITTGLVGDNLLDVDVRNSVQFHKDEILMPGRSIKFFMNAKFGGVPPVNKGGYYKAPTGFGAPIFKAPIRSAWTWAGFYVGGTIGYGWGKSNTDTVFSDPATSGQLFATSGARKLGRGDRRRPGRLQLGCRQCAGRGGSGSQLFRPARENASWLPGRGLQYGARRRCQRSVGTGDLRPGPEAGMVCHIPRAARRNRYACYSRLCHGRARHGRDHDRRHGVRLRRRRQPGQHDRQQPQHQGGLDNRRRRGGSPGRKLDRQDRIPVSRPGIGLDGADARAECDGGGCLQFARQRQHRASRRQLQIRPQRDLGQLLTGRSAPDMRAARRGSCCAPPDATRAGTEPWPRRSCRETPRVRRAFRVAVQRSECLKRRRAPPFPRAISAASRPRRATGSERACVPASASNSSRLSSGSRRPVTKRTEANRAPGARTTSSFWRNRSPVRNAGSV